jgi:hypothetical protein
MGSEESFTAFVREQRGDRATVLRQCGIEHRKARSSSAPNGSNANLRGQGPRAEVGAARR